MAKNILQSGWGIKNIPNYLTILRILIVPILLIIYPWDFKSTTIICGFLFAFASLTDFFDGFIARIFSVESRLGALLDPIADKLLSAAGLLLLASTQKIPVLLAGLLLLRDIAMSGLRLIAMEEGKSIPVNIFGKLKTFLQSIALTLLLIHYPLFNLPLREIGMIMIWITLIVAYYSAYVYFANYWRMESTSPDENLKV